MKVLTLCLLLAWTSGGDREQGLEAYRAGRWAEAVQCFERALAAAPNSAELQWNLALARWRAGDRKGAELAVETYAALAPNARGELRDGLLGALRYDEAKELEAKVDQGGEPDPVATLETALQKAKDAKDCFVRGVLAAPSPELQRNAERTLRLIDELQKKIEEQKKQQEQQKKDDQKKNDQKKDDEKKPDDQKKQDDQKKSDDKQQDDQKQQDDKQQDPQQQDQPKPDDPSQGQSGEQPPEPKPQPESQGDGKEQPQPAEPQPADQPKDQPQAGEQPDQAQQTKPEQAQGSEARKDAPGEGEVGALTPEQEQRLREKLQELEQQLRAIRARAASRRRANGRDW